MFLSPWQQGATAIAQQPVIPETQPLAETWRSVNYPLELNNYLSHMPVCFVFERARAPRHFLLSKGHPMSQLQISTAHRS